MKEKLSYKSLTKTLKHLLKIRGVKYKELASELNLSEITIKKTLNSADGSVDRILKICELLDISFQDLVQKASEQGEFKPSNLDHQKQNEITLDKDFFDFYWSLFIERISLESTIQHLKLPKDRYYKYLKTLDEWGVLQWKQGDKITLPAKSLMKFSMDSPISLYLRNFVLEEAKRDNRSPYPQNLRWAFTRLTKKSLQNFENDLEDLVLNYCYHGKYEMATRHYSDLESVSILCSIIPKSPTELP